PVPQRRGPYGRPVPREMLAAARAEARQEGRTPRRAGKDERFEWNERRQRAERTRGDRPVYGEHTRRQADRNGGREYRGRGPHGSAPRVHHDYTPKR
ncbi:MAG: hypothetical protein IKS52_11135, partial [Clostridia bacterium]|nr:hypothetical protein [Clostridia bacterium]